jgi:mannose-6-phosphate isomerase-like protein (cupin superfamily)
MSEVEIEGFGRLEDYIIRFSEIEERRSDFRPRDMALERFERERYSIVGRPEEGSTKGKRTSEDVPFSVVMLKIEPGKGFASHAHDTPEVFIFMSGKWELTVADQTSEVGDWDVALVPPGVWHSIKNLGTMPGWVLGINSGQAGAPTRLAPAVMEELRKLGASLTDVEYPPGALPSKGL